MCADVVQDARISRTSSHTHRHFQVQVNDILTDGLFRRSALIVQIQFELLKLFLKFTDHIEHISSNRKVSDSGNRVICLFE